MISRHPNSNALPSLSVDAAAADRSTTTTTDPPFFTLISADEVAYTFALTPYMCTRSLYLQTAKEVGAAEGAVPVGSAQAVRDYVSYLQYLDLRAQLSAELEKGRDRPTSNKENRGSLVVSPTTASSSAEVRRQTHAAAGQDNHTSVSNLRQQQQQQTGARRATDDEWLAPFLREESLLSSSILDSIAGEMHLSCGEGSEPVGYEVKPLDCDRTYAQHAQELRGRLTVESLSAFRGGATPADQEDAGFDGRGERTRGDANHGLAVGVAASGVYTSENANEPAASTYVDAEDVRLQRPPPLLLSSSSSSSSRSSSSSSVSETSLAAYRAEAHRDIAGGSGPRSVGQGPGYGAYLALDAREGVFFVERVLLPHEWRRSHGAARANRCTAADQTVPSLPSTASAVLLTASQQRRLLELISVADFLGTQSLVELCANYLAAWLMDRTDEEIVESFLVETAGEGSSTTSASAARFGLTGASPFQEPWLKRPAAPSTTDGAATEAPTSSAQRSTDARARTELKATRKKDAPAAMVAPQRKTAGRGKRGKGTEEPVHDEGEEKRNEKDSPSAAEAASASNARPRRALLSGDQRLSVVRQVKRSGSIMISPY
ncbi:hypothetical protein ABB37_04471 [Leptomonas pyrrhocoris]|uniref:Uncharacterized protein n=1 Tax=Leptomonas pyrrhocoris TaxID=157538 RepID=A0A0N0VFG7_LEPPY|nr:hypothetical protein ABB37_04471 [Leptomonas pyrrhocoris]KPA81121.1 hypothetical protein ABB37_04471 [Leptomonas pyrrhocoris]|eukprot:XP_015659560.1 hypothetical protein ABB37_04471 [Leptomonas pyrrhocoris]